MGHERLPDIIDAIEGEFKAHGVKYRVENTGERVRFFFKVDGKNKKFFLHTTPSDSRSLLNSRAQLRKMLGDCAGIQTVLGKLNKSLKIIIPNTLARKIGATNGTPVEIVGDHKRVKVVVLETGHLHLRRYGAAKSLSVNVSCNKIGIRCARMKPLYQLVTVGPGYIEFKDLPFSPLHVESLNGEDRRVITGTVISGQKKYGDESERPPVVAMTPALEKKAPAAADKVDADIVTALGLLQEALETAKKQGANLRCEVDDRGEVSVWRKI
jgi:hypothetical protein